MKWHELEEKERIEKVYSNYTIQQFWDWWSDGANLWMEIRTVNWKIAKQIAEKFSIPYSHTGVFVNNGEMLKKVIMYVRQIETNVWFGIQPRKRAYNERGHKVLSGGDIFVYCIKFIFVDIDRKVKKGPASLYELSNCDYISDKILERFETEKWNKNCMKVCSGNGVQLFIKIDIPIIIPEVDYQIVINDKKKLYVPIENKDFVKCKRCLSNTIGKQIENYVKRICKKEELDNIDLDNTSFRIAQVASLPFTKNYKYGGFTWRGILDVKNEVNEGLSDYILYLEETFKDKKVKNIFNIVARRFTKTKRINKGELESNPLAKFMLEYDFPEGGINNTLWFQMKCLLRDSNVDLNSEEFIIFHKKIKDKHGRSFSLNLPRESFEFNESVVNNYCIEHNLQPIYKLWPRLNKPTNYFDTDLKWEDIKLYKTNSNINLSNDTTIFEDMYECKSRFKNDLRFNLMLAYCFTNACIKKYGEEQTKYYFNLLFNKYFRYKK